LNMA